VASQRVDGGRFEGRADRKGTSHGHEHGRAGDSAVTFRAMFIEELRARREQTRRPQSPADGVRAPAPSNVRMPPYVMPG